MIKTETLRDWRALRDALVILEQIEKRSMDQSSAALASAASAELRACVEPSVLDIVRDAQLETENDIRREVEERLISESAQWCRENPGADQRIGAFVSVKQEFCRVETRLRALERRGK